VDSPNCWVIDMSKFKNNLIDTNIFPSFIVSTDLRSLVSNDSVRSDFIDIRNSDDGIKKTNVGGWHSELFNNSDLSDTISKYEHLNLLYNLSVEFIDEFLDENKTNLYVSRATGWLLENETSAYNTLHNHGKTDLIAVYYVDIPEKCSGIRLLRTDAFTQTALCGSNSSPQFSTSFAPTVTPGRLFVIPGHLYHYVESFDSEGKRRSVVFNINCDDKSYRQSE
jgi:uncharacterized protein (TIGR02466 family)